MPVVDASAPVAGASSGVVGGAPTGEGTAVAEAPPNIVTDELASMGWAARIQGLKKQTTQLREQRQRVAKELKAAQRKNRRLKERARCLSEEDMLQILVMKRARTADNASSADVETGGSGNGSSNASTVVTDAVAAEVGTTRAESSPPSDGGLDDARADD